MMRERKQAASFTDVLRAELDEISRQRASRSNGAKTKDAPSVNDPVQAAHRAKLTGLAFSGGGIRSATFNLGVLQGLAKFGLLPSFDYLSTVSGGGYIGSWLTSWTRRTSGIEAVQQSILPQRREHSDHREAEQISFLRSYSNYLTPRVGALSLDTWTFVTTYARNLLLNLSILVLAVSALLMLPRVAVAFHLYFTGAMNWTGSVAWLLWISFLLLTLALTVVSLNLSQPPTEARNMVGRQRFSCSPSAIWLLVVIPILIAAWLVSAGIWIWLKPQQRVEIDVTEWVLSVGLLYAMLWLVGSLITVASAGPPVPVDQGAATPSSTKSSRLISALRVVPGAFIAGMATGLMVCGLVWWVAQWKDALGVEIPIASFGMWAIVVIFALTAVIHIGIVGRGFSEEAREWWSRLGAVLLLTATGLAVLSAIAIFGPTFVDWLWQKLQVWGTAALASSWLLSSIVGAAFGKQAPVSGSEPMPSYKRALMAVAPYIFISGLLLMLSWSVREVLPSVLDTLNGWFGPSPWWQRITMALDRNLWPLLMLPVVLFGVSLLISWRIGINDFSLHAGYRNRLVRCYFGASNNDRHPNPFTGFDPADDAATMSAFTSDAGFRGPYPIINTALNLVRGDQLAWQSRKAASFVFTPRYCGYDYIAQRSMGPHAKLSAYGYRPSDEFGSGVTLGTAMAISGAAASPNMGYHTSSAMAFLMTVFNVRLGWWLGNPRHNIAWRRSGPPVGIFYLLRELLGLTNDRSSYIYLSDGGHFENLGLYELVRRRCRFILACDVDADGDLTFGDLGNAIERIRADFGINISIDVKKIRTASNGYSESYCTIGRIHYGDVDEGAEDGWLVFVKSSCTGTEPLDVLAYRSQYPTFPHQSTGDQWFDEAQFESYRALGEHVVQQVLCDAEGMERPSAEKALEAAIKRWNAKPAAG